MKRFVSQIENNDAANSVCYVLTLRRPFFALSSRFAADTGGVSS